MNETIKISMVTARLGDPQIHANVMIFPLISPSNGACRWITLGEAIEKGTLTISEVSHNGSVPELKAINKGDRPVLLLDGEELLGAKQNRVLNTTILLKEHSETFVPVSCTEQGRWNYASAQFSSADTLLSQKVRANKLRSVSESLARESKYSSDQGAVWDGIQHLQASAGTASPTGAMHDTFKAYDHQLKQYLNTFPWVPGQTGLLVMIDGEVTGLDLIPHSEVYQRLHSKLVNSYVIDALTSPKPKPSDLFQARTLAQSFLAAVIDTEEQPFPSIGHGTDFRFKKQGIGGAALVHDQKVVHVAFFSIPPETPGKNSIISSSRRRGHYS